MDGNHKENQDGIPADKLRRLVREYEALDEEMSVIAKKMADLICLAWTFGIDTACLLKVLEHRKHERSLDSDVVEMIRALADQK